MRYRKVKKLVLIGPSNLALREFLTVCWWWRRIRDFGYKESSRRFRNAVNKNTEEWDPEENVEAHPKSE